MKTTSNVREIDYLELCQFVSTRQAFTIRWCDRYQLMSRLYWAKTRLIRAQIDAKWVDQWPPPPEIEQLQMELEHYNQKLERCWAMHSILIRYGQYFSNLPFRVLRNQPIPDCFWYVPEAQTPPKDGSQNY